MTDSELLERMQDVCAASIPVESSEHIDSLDLRLIPIMTHTRMYFTDVYPSNPLGKYLKIAVKKATIPFFDEQLVFNGAVKDILWEIKNRIQELEATQKRQEEYIRYLENRLIEVEADKESDASSH
jgi:hypothetical protein